jgi:hypothetical protein
LDSLLIIRGDSPQLYIQDGGHFYPLQNPDASLPEKFWVGSSSIYSGSIVGTETPLSPLNPIKDYLLSTSYGFHSIQPLTFFDSLVEDLPAIPTLYDGSYSFSSQSGAYHILAGVVTDGYDDYAFFCAKRASSTFVRIVPPLQFKEAIHLTSRYAKFWVSNPPGSTPVQGEVPAEYCRYGIMISGGSSGASRFLDFSYQVFKDWVSFSGRTTEPCTVQVVIKRLETMEVVKNLSTSTSGSNNSFYLATHLEPGDYTYEACAYPVGSGSES